MESYMSGSVDLQQKETKYFWIPAASLRSVAKELDIWANVKGDDVYLELGNGGLSEVLQGPRVNITSFDPGVDGSNSYCAWTYEAIKSVLRVTKGYYKGLCHYDDGVWWIISQDGEVKEQSIK